MLGIHDRDDRFVYVTDGGQLDNLGLLELLSRRCEVICCIDASGDAEATTNTFDGVRRLAFERLGVKILPAPDVEPLDGERDDYDCVPAKILDGYLTSLLCTRPKRSTLEHSSPYPAGLAGRFVGDDVVLLRIVYPGDVLGWLIYAKAVLTAKTPVETLEFAGSWASFPRDSTADQFLEPEQVEHYVALGRHIGQRAGVLARPLLGLPPRAEPAAPPSVVVATAEQTTVVVEVRTTEDDGDGPPPVPSTVGEQPFA